MRVELNTQIQFTQQRLLSVPGADGITIHLREDRRHILDRDVRILAETIQTRMNLEMAVTDEMVQIALDTKPEFVCLVPEKREELTTEGGLDVVGQLEKVKAATQKLTEAGIKVSLFIDADREQIDAAKACGAPFIELHTGHYAEAKTEEDQQDELKKIAAGASYADDPRYHSECRSRSDLPQRCANRRSTRDLRAEHWSLCDWPCRI